MLTLKRSVLTFDPRYLKINIRNQMEVNLRYLLDHIPKERRDHDYFRLIEIHLTRVSLMIERLYFRKSNWVRSRTSYTLHQKVTVKTEPVRTVKDSVRVLVSVRRNPLHRRGNFHRRGPSPVESTNNLCWIVESGVLPQVSRSTRTASKSYSRKRGTDERVVSWPGLTQTQ